MFFFNTAVGAKALSVGSSKVPSQKKRKLSNQEKYDLTASTSAGTGYERCEAKKLKRS